MLKQKFLLALKVQSIHLLLCIVWNVVGVIQVSMGIQSIGPTASIAAIIVISILLTLMIISLNKNWRPVYLIASSVALIFSMLAIYGAFTKETSQWPSEFWRFSGVIVNSIGILGFIFLLKALIKKEENRIG